MNGDGFVDNDDLTMLIAIMLGISEDSNGTADINEVSLLDITDLTSLISLITPICR